MRRTGVSECDPGFCTCIRMHQSGCASRRRKADVHCLCNRTGRRVVQAMEHARRAMASRGGGAAAARLSELKLTPEDYYCEKHAFEK